MNFLMAYLSAADRIENIVAGAEHNQNHHQEPHHAQNKGVRITKTKICWLLLILTVAIPMAIFIGILEFFPSLMDISQDILNERKANKAVKAVQADNFDAQPPWNYNNGNMPPVNPMYAPPPLYPPPPIARDQYHPKAAFDHMNDERNRNVPPPPLPPSPPVDGDYSPRTAFENLNAERSPYERYHQLPNVNPNYRIFQGLGQDGYPPLTAAEEDSEEEGHRDSVRSPENLQIDSADAKLLLSKIDPNWLDKVAAFKSRMQQRST